MDESYPLGDNDEHLSANQYDHEQVLGNDEVVLSNETHTGSTKHVHATKVENYEAVGSYKTHANSTEKNHNGTTNLNVVDGGESLERNNEQPIVPTLISHPESSTPMKQSLT